MLMLAPFCAALVLPGKPLTEPVGRRGALGALVPTVLGGALALGGARAAGAVSARTGLSSVFTGEYDDPNHPGCLRSIKVVGGGLGPDGKQRKLTALVKGVDGKGAKGACAERPELKDVWSLNGKVSKGDDGEDLLFVDFSPKGGPSNLLGQYDTFGGVPGVKFPDGNKWTKVAAGTPNRRPPNDTLNSD